MILERLMKVSFTSAFMIGGKAYGKGFAIENSAKIVLQVGKIMAMFEKKKKKRQKKSSEKRR